MPQFIDLSVAIDNNEHSDHPGGSLKGDLPKPCPNRGWPGTLFPGAKPSDLPDGEGWAVETITRRLTTAPTWTRPGTFIPPPTTAKPVRQH